MRGQPLLAIKTVGKTALALHYSLYTGSGTADGAAPSAEAPGSFHISHLGKHLGFGTCFWKHDLQHTRYCTQPSAPTTDTSFVTRMRNYKFPGQALQQFRFSFDRALGLLLVGSGQLTDARRARRMHEDGARRRL